jgi:SAM-dependent methyltransferase
MEAPDKRAMAAWYEQEYWMQYREEQTGPARDNLHAHVLMWLERLSPGRGLIVDVGCGGGAFLAASQARGWKGLGVEPSHDAAAHARQRGLTVHEGAWPVAAIADCSVDAVTFINVLDHLADPLGALRAAHRVLKPGGLLYVRVPNAPVHVLIRRVLGCVGLGRIAVLHLHGFGRRSLSAILPRMGFAPMMIKTSPPAQGCAYLKVWTPAGMSYRVLKLMDRLLYGLTALIGLDRLGWGASIEVMARKSQGPDGGTAHA